MNHVMDEGLSVVLLESPTVVRQLYIRHVGGEDCGARGNAFPHSLNVDWCARNHLTELPCAECVSSGQKPTPKTLAASCHTSDKPRQHRLSTALPTRTESA